MNATELAALRDRVSRATLEQPVAPVAPNPKAAAGAQALRAMKLAGKCVYCGLDVAPQKRRTGKPLTCRAHRDLPACDPFYGGGME